MKTLEMIVPCFNESDVLGIFYNEIGSVLRSLDGFDYRLIFVNDGSKDNTLEIIKGFAEKDERIKYISFSRNFGKEAAMLAGLRYSSADYVGILDADLQHSPSLIVKMLDALENEGYDVAAAKRSDRKGESKLKSLLSDSFYRVANKLTEVEIDSGAQDYRIMKRKVVEAILSLAEYNRFTKGIFSWVGFKTKWFEHENRERAAGTTKWNIKKLLKYAIDGILGFSNVPLRLSFDLGLALTAVGLIYALVFLIVHYGVNPAFSGVHIILAAIVISCGLILTCLGIVGEYIARIYNEVKSRPAFIVDETNIGGMPK